MFHPKTEKKITSASERVGCLVRTKRIETKANILKYTMVSLKAPINSEKACFPRRFEVPITGPTATDHVLSLLPSDGKSLPISVQNL